MARMEALLSDVRSGLQTLRSERAIVNLTVEKAGELTYQAREAVTLIQTLREERRASDRFLEALRAEDEEDDGRLAG